MASVVADKILNHMTAIVKALDCAICLSIIKSPVSMGCGHFFCRFCIAEVLKSNYRTPCPLCKRSFTRRSIEDADQRNAIVLAAGKLVLECGKLTGSNIVSPDAFNMLKDLNETVSSPIALLDETKETPKPSKSKKRKSQENNEPEKVSKSRSCTSEVEFKIQAPQSVSTSAKISKESDVPQCEPASDDDYEEFELPSLSEILASVQHQDTAKQQEMNNKVDDLEKKPSNTSNKKSLKVSFADTPTISCDLTDSSICKTSSNNSTKPNQEINKPNRKDTKNESDASQSNKSRVSKLRESVKNKKNALKNKTNHISNDSLNETSGNKKKLIDDSTKSPDVMAKENRNIVNLNKDSSLIDETSLLVMSPTLTVKERSKTKRSTNGSGKAKMDSNTNSDAELEALISKIKAAENFTLTVESNRSDPVSLGSKSSNKECYSLNETDLSSMIENADESHVNAAQSGLKEYQGLITDTAVSVQSVVSPTANKLESLAKSPGWSKVRQVGKDFRVKKFSKLQVEKNSGNSCQMDSDVSEDKSKYSPNEMPKLIKISDLQRESSDININKGNCIPMNYKSLSDSNESPEHQTKKSLGIDSSVITVTAEVHSQEVCPSNSSTSKENSQREQNDSERNNYLSNCKETETSIVMNAIEKSQGSNHEKNLCNGSPNITEKGPGYGLAHFDDSCIPPSDMQHDKEKDVENKNTFLNNMESTLFDTYDSHVIENEEMEIDELEHNDHVMPPNSSLMHEKGIVSHNNKINGILSRFGKQSIMHPPNIPSKKSKNTRISPNFGFISQCSTTCAKTVFDDETVSFASHSQQTSQRLLEFCGNNEKIYKETVAPTPDLSLYPVLNMVRESVPFQNQVSLYNKPIPSGSERTKVLKRTCLTLEEIQDAFSNCNKGRPVTICSLPFSSGEFRLDINVADETLNVSILKVDSYEKPSEMIKRTPTLILSEKNVQTSSFLSSPISVVPSSAGSEPSQPEYESPEKDTSKTAKNLFPYLNQYFSDSEPTQQNSLAPGDNESPLNVSEILPYCRKDKGCIPVQENNTKEVESVVEGIDALLCELKALPPKDFSISDVQKVIGNESELVKETQRQNDEIVPSICTSDADESFSYDDLPPTQIACRSADIYAPNTESQICENFVGNSGKQREEGLVLESLKVPCTLENVSIIQSANKIPFGNRSSTSPGEERRAVHSRLSSLNAKSSHFERYSKPGSDPDRVMAAELVGPLKDLAEEMKATGTSVNNHADTSYTSAERHGNQKRPLEVFEEMVLSKNIESTGNCLPSQRASRLSLKSKGNPKKFKRIQKFTGSDDSDSSKEDMDTEKNLSPQNNGEVLPPSSKEIIVNGSLDNSTAHSFASLDQTNGNTSDIAMEIESLDQKIQSVMIKLKDCGHGDLLEGANGLDILSKLKDDVSISLEDDASSDDSQKSTDIFTVPPTPPDAV